jgi:hypothetical protein
LKAQKILNDRIKKKDDENSERSEFPFHELIFQKRIKQKAIPPNNVLQNLQLTPITVRKEDPLSKKPFTLKISIAIDINAGALRSFFPNQI